MEIKFTNENEARITELSTKLGISPQDFLNALIRCTDLSRITEFPISVGIDKAIANTELFDGGECLVTEMEIERLKCLFIQELFVEKSIFNSNLTPNDVSRIIYSRAPRFFDEIMWR